MARAFKTLSHSLSSIEAEPSIITTTSRMVKLTHGQYGLPTPMCSQSFVGARVGGTVGLYEGKVVGSVVGSSVVGESDGNEVGYSVGGVVGSSE